MNKSSIFLVVSLCLGLAFVTSIGIAQETDPVLFHGETDKNIESQYGPYLFVQTRIGPKSGSVQTQSAEIEDDGDLFEEYDQEETAPKDVADPLYGFNYAMYSLNDVLYFYALKPVAQGYKAVVPEPARKGIRNFFYNLMFPVRFVNSILQGKMDRAGDELGIFLTNSTVGILGFNRFAQTHLGLKNADEDLGQTFGSWGFGNGFYLVLPILGPTTLRDGLGGVGDYFITPLNYAEPWELYWGATGLDKVNKTSFRIGDYEALKEAALDPYAAIRNAYIQNRNSQVLK